MEDRIRNERDRRRLREGKAWKNRAGALDRRWGYGRRFASGYSRRPGAPMGSAELEDEYIDDYNAPDYWDYQREWMRPGPYTGIGPRGYRRSDESIHEDVCRRLTQHGGIDARSIKVEVEDGEVTLEGSVEDRRAKRMVEANVELIPGVLDIHNRLKLRNKHSERDRRREAARRNPFPGGPVPTGRAGYEEGE